MTDPAAPLPADDHSHSQFSWDAFGGDMHGSCARAAAVGLPAIAFTEHVEFTAWSAPDGGWTWPEGVRGRIDEHGHFMGSPLYQEAIPSCRRHFPDLLIRSGVEVSEVHRHPGAVRDLLSRGFDRVVGSIHALADLRTPGDLVLVDHAVEQCTPVGLLRAYLREVEAMAASDGP